MGILLFTFFISLCIISVEEDVVEDLFVE